MDQTYSESAIVRIKGCYHEAFRHDVVELFKWTPGLTEIMEDLKSGSINVGHILMRASHIKGSFVRDFIGTQELTDAIIFSCKAAELYEEWKDEYCYRFKQFPDFL